MIKLKLRSSFNGHHNFSYGFGSKDISSNYKNGDEVMGVRRNMNYYELADGTMIHIYHAYEV